MNQFDVQARLAFYYAREEANALQQLRLTPGHLLLGLMHSEGGARTVLERLGARLESLRTLYQHLSPVVERVQTSRPASASFSPQIRRVIGDASREAHNLGTETTSSQHILLALMNVRNAVLRQMLNSVHPDLDLTRGHAQEITAVIERVSLDYRLTPLPERTQEALTRLLKLAEHGGDTSGTARLTMIELLLRTGDPRLLPWLERVVYRWLTEDQMMEEEKRAVLHLLMAELLPRKDRLSAG